MNPIEEALKPIPEKPKGILSPYYQMVCEDGWCLMVEVLHIDPLELWKKLGNDTM